MKKTAIGDEGIYDARVLGIPRMLILGVQHMFAMFGATVLVPLLTGLDVATTLLFAGLGTLLFHLITKFKVPAFLGSSFAFLGGYATVKALVPEGADKAAALPYACLGVACAGLLYLVLAGLIKLVGVDKVMNFFPPVVTGPIIIAIGLNLAGSAVSNCQANWIIAVIALLIIVIFNIWGKGMLKILPILLGVLGACAIAAALALAFGETITVVNEDQTVSHYIAIAGKESLKLFSVEAIDNLKSAAWIGFPVKWKETVFGGIDWHNTSLIVSSIIAIMPIALATMMEHIGDISAISSTVNRNYIADPGLHRTLTGDGLATVIASLFGAPANTTYGENTGVLALSRVYDPRVIRLAAIFAAAVSFCPKFSALINLIPTAVIGGISFVLYGMISAIGVRNVVENHVDFTKSRNLITAAVILVCALGLGNAVSFSIGRVNISLTALAVASIAGIVLNAVLPGKDYKFSASGAATPEQVQEPEQVQTPEQEEQAPEQEDAGM